MDSDRLLRLQTSTSTAHSYYDQVVAVSQKIINNAFSNLYEVYPQFKRVDYDNRRIGSIHADLLSPRLLLGGAIGADVSPTSCLYVMRFDAGTLTMPNDDPSGADYVEDMSGWELAVTVDLRLQSVAVNPNSDQATQEMDQKTVDFFKSKFDVPGDYSIERLFAKLSDASWRQFDFDNSNFGVNEDGTKRSFAQLLRIHPYLEDDLQTMLRSWARAQEANHLTTIGVNFQLPDPKTRDPLKASFEPVAMYHQVYPYINPEKGVPAAVASYDPPGDLNALLYCEVVANSGNTLPKDKQLQSTGLFTCQADKIGGKRIDGTFALSHQLFVEIFLLPMLQPFNQSSEVCPTTPSATYDDNKSTIHWSYMVGSDGINLDPKSDVYKFTPVFDPGHLADVRSYIYTKDNTVKLPKLAHNTNGNTFGGFESSGTPKVTLSWVPGSSSFDVKGETTYKYDIEWADNEQLVRPFGWLRDTFVFTWNFSIVLVSITDGVLNFRVDAGPNGDANVTVAWPQHEKQNSETPPNQDVNIRNDIAGRLKGHVQMLETNLQNAFNSTGKFIYPGNGTFDFSQPIIGNTGEILAEILYKPVVHGKIVVPPPSNATIQTAPITTATPVTVAVPTVHPSILLGWAVSSPIKAEQKAVEITVTGTNTTQQDVVLSSVTIRLMASEAGTGLITSSKLNPGKFIPKNTTSSSTAPPASNLYQLIQNSADNWKDVKLLTEDLDDETSRLTFRIIADLKKNVTLKPNESVQLALLADTGVAGTQTVEIFESWPVKAGQAPESLVHPISVILQT